MRRVILVRHGESELNARQQRENMFCGQLETPLTEFGRRQAREAGRRLADDRQYAIACAVSSTLNRACETLDLILSQFSTLPLRLPADAAFNERSLGVFEGRTEADVFAEYPEYRDHPELNRFRADYHQKAPKGESLAEVTLRASQGLRNCLNRTQGTLMIVAHCQTIRCLLAEKLGIVPDEITRIPVPHATPIVLTQVTEQEWRRIDE